MIGPWLVALYGATVLAAALVFGYDEYRHNTRPATPYEWVQRAGALLMVSLLWPVVLLAGWRRQRVVPVPPRPPVELKAYTGPTSLDPAIPVAHQEALERLVPMPGQLVYVVDEERHYECSNDLEWVHVHVDPPGAAPERLPEDVTEWGPVVVDPKDPEQRPHQKKPCGCARDGFLREYAHCADHQPEHAFQPAQPWMLGPGTIVTVREGESEGDAISRYMAEMGVLPSKTPRQPDYVARYIGDLGTWRESCGCTYTDEGCDQIVTYCRKHGPGLPRCDCRWDQRVRRTVSCLDHQHFETPSVVLTSLPRSPQPGEVCRVGDTVFGFDGLEWARIQPVVEEGL